MTEPNMPAALLATQRRHDVDALRAIAFALLILYHLGMAYVADWGWHVKSAHTAEWLQWPMMVMNRWRMPLLFLLSGLAVGLIAGASRPARAPGRFAASRTYRLLLPLLFGMLAIVPIQAYCQGVFNAKVAPGFGQFLLDYFSFQPWPEGAFDGAKEGITWNHLWYLPYLWVYSLALLALLPLLESQRGQALMQRLSALPWPGLWLLLGLPAGLSMLLLVDAWPPRNNLITDWYQHALYFGVFVSGYLLARGGAHWDTLARARKALLALSLLLSAVYFPALAMIDEAGPALLAAMRALRMLYMSAVLLTLLGWAAHALNRPFPWLAWANESVYPWYLLHQSLIVALAFYLTPLQLGPVLEPLLVLAGTVLSMWALNESMIRRVRWLRPLFGLPARSQIKAPTATAGATNQAQALNNAS
jgi:glucans biosynthesis protein C